MKIYTGSGDRGKTSLFSGERVSKDHVRVEAYGDVDELNAVLGALAAMLPLDQSELIDRLKWIQGLLLHVGAWLSATPGSQALNRLKGISNGEIKLLEQAIDHMEEALPELRHFILSGGHPSAAWAHIARTVCRRAERRVVEFLETASESRGSEDFKQILVFLNRLSDYLFVLARYCNHIHGVRDTAWIP